MTPDELGRLYEEHRAGFIKWARMLLGGDDGAEDLVQWVFSLDPARLDEAQNVLSWLRSRLYMQAIRCKRRGSKAPRQVEYTESSHDKIYQDESWAVCQDLERVLEQVPERWRRMYIQYKVEGYTFMEIGALEGVTWQRVRQVVRQVERKVQTALAGWLP